jgi:hypothetical protein
MSPGGKNYLRSQLQNSENQLLTGRKTANICVKSSILKSEIWAIITKPLVYLALNTSTGSHGYSLSPYIDLLVPPMQMH